MSKVYIKPQTRPIAIQPGSIIAQSVSSRLGSGSAQTAAYGRRRGWRDDEDDEEM